MARTLLNIQVRGHPRRHQWSETLRAAKAADPTITGDRLLGRLLRRFRTGLARDLGGAELARLLAEKKPARTTKGPPPPRPPNVH